MPVEEETHVLNKTEKRSRVLLTVTEKVENLWLDEELSWNEETKVNHDE